MKYVKLNVREDPVLVEGAPGNYNENVKFDTRRHRSFVPVVFHSQEIAASSKRNAMVRVCCTVLVKRVVGSCPVCVALIQIVIDMLQSDSGLSAGHVLINVAFILPRSENRLQSVG